MLVLDGEWSRGARSSSGAKARWCPRIGTSLGWLDGVGPFFLGVVDLGPHGCSGSPGFHCPLALTGVPGPPASMPVGAHWRSGSPASMPVGAHWRSGSPGSMPLALTGVPGPPARVGRGEHNPLASRRRPRGFAAAAVGSARRLRPFGRALPTATAAKPHGLRLAGCSVPTRAGPERPGPCHSCACRSLLPTWACEFAHIF
jgi:hypothetical protein